MKFFSRTIFWITLLSVNSAFAWLPKLSSGDIFEGKMVSNGHPTNKSCQIEVLTYDSDSSHGVHCPLALIRASVDGQIQAVNFQANDNCSRGWCRRTWQYTHDLVLCAEIHDNTIPSAFEILSGPDSPNIFISRMTDNSGDSLTVPKFHNLFMKKNGEVDYYEDYDRSGIFTSVKLCKNLVKKY